MNSYKFLLVLTLIFFSLSLVSAEDLTVSSSTTLCGNLEYDNVLIESGATVYVCDYNGTAGTGILNFTVEDTFTLESGAVINGNGRGYRGAPRDPVSGYDGNNGEGFGAGQGGNYDNTGDPQWLGGGGGAGYGTAGGAGGQGGISGAAGGAGGVMYGNETILDVIYLGSGGGSGAVRYGDAGQGGDGGGAFALYAKNVNIFGQIVMSGDTAAYGGPYGSARFAGSGGGSGGSIFIKGKFVNTSSSLLQANGGSGSNAYFYYYESGAAGGGGGGSGGRITLDYKYTLDNSSSTVSVSAGSGGAEDDGGSNGNSGASGRVYYTQEGVFSIETLDELLSTYSFEYSFGNITILEYYDIMQDSNSDGINDILLFNLSIGNTTSGNYEVYIDVDDDSNVITRGDVFSLGESFSNASINFSTDLFSGSNIFEYTVRVYDSEDNLVLRKSRLNTNNYSSYYLGPRIINVTDSNDNNNSIVLNVVINSSISTVENISAYLNYESSVLSSAVSPISLNVGINNIQIYFDNESIKKTHYNGSFVIDGISIGEKKIPLNISTSNYSYEDFAKTSYLKSYNFSLFDLDSNDLVDYMEINTTVNVRDSGNYTLVLDVYEIYGDHLKTLEKNVTLSTGLQIVSMNISGEHIYSSELNGPYMISVSNLFYNSELIDFDLDSYEFYIENMSYYDFERPPRPDLNVINMTTDFNYTHNFFNVTIENTGESKAFNVVLDIFDGYDYEDMGAISELGVNETYNFTFSTLAFESNRTVAAVVDFDGLIDETNETNNFDVINATVFNMPPEDSFILSPYSGEIVDSDLINIKWNSSYDLNSNYVRYFLEYSNDSGSTWNSIIDNFGLTNSWKNDTAREINFSSSQDTEIFYLRIPKNSTISSAKINLEGISA